MTTENTNTTSPATEAVEEVVKLDLSTVPALPITRNGVTIPFAPTPFTKKGDRKGQFFYSIPEDYFTPEAVNKVQQFFGDKMYFKRLLNSARQLFQGLDNNSTKKGTLPLDTDEITRFVQEMSTRGEPIGELKIQVDLLKSWLMLLQESELSDSFIKETFTTINAQATKKHEEQEDSDETDPVLLTEETLASVLERYNKLNNNPVFKQLDKDERAATIQGGVYRTISEEMKKLDVTIKANSRTRKKKGESAETETEETAEAVTA